MVEYKAASGTARRPSHPGAAIKDILEDLRVTKKQIAEKLGISRQQFHHLLAGSKPLSPQVAVRVAALLGGSTASWLRMQAAYDAWHASRTLDVSAIKRLTVAKRKTGA